jgi:hypothetical protein
MSVADQLMIEQSKGAVSVALRTFEVPTIEWPVMVTADVRAASRERRRPVLA